MNTETGRPLVEVLADHPALVDADHDVAGTALIAAGIERLRLGNDRQAAVELAQAIVKLHAEEQAP